jgi:hypothetical protein
MQVPAEPPLFGDPSNKPVPNLIEIVTDTEHAKKAANYRVALAQYAQQVAFPGNLTATPPDIPTPDLQGIAECVVLKGHCVGNSVDRSNHTRLYKDLKFNEWVDVPHAEILHYIHLFELSRDRFLLGGTLVWVTRNAEVISGERETDVRKTSQAHFLSGEIGSMLGEGGTSDPRGSSQYCSSQYCSSQYCSSQYCSSQYCSSQYCSSQFCSSPYCSSPYC